MRLVKENAFLFGTAGVLVVAVAVFVVLKHSEDSKADTNIADRVGISRELSSLAADGVNEDKVTRATDRVEEMRSEARRVTEAFLRRNRHGKRIMRFDVSGQKVAAFPVDPEMRDRETLRLLFPEQYERLVLVLLDSLTPASPPTEKEIADEIERVVASALPADGSTGTGRTATPSRPRPRVREDFRGGELEEFERFRSERPYRPRTSTRRPGATETTEGDAEFEPTPEQKAQRNLVVSKSKQGLVYADKQSMYIPFVEGAQYPDEDLWLAHVGLWVQQDIVKAISLTNRAAQTRGGGLGGVPASAVKHLVSINVRGYVLGRKATVRSEGRGKTVPADEAPTLEYIRMGGQATGGRSGRLSRAHAVPQLTGRACSKLYDVVHYDFTVVLPMRHLAGLYQNLLAQNYHTILHVRADRAVQTDRTGRSSVMEHAARGTDQGLFYYGTDPVMQVTITGELLLLADWTRGRWDPQAGKWERNYPPMMPEEFLKMMNVVDPDALRKEDKKRLPAEAETPAGRRMTGRS